MKYIEIDFLFIASLCTKIVHGIDDFLINTPGCYIPNYMKTYYLADSANVTWTHPGNKCGRRAVYIDHRYDEDTIEFRIDNEALTKDRCKAATCQYRLKNNVWKKKNVAHYFNNSHNGTVKHDTWVWVTCRIKKRICYDDWYPILKKLPDISKQADNKNISIENTSNENTSNENTSNKREQTWNVLIIGMDTMSRGRMQINMPLVHKYLKQQQWLDYRAYNKVAYNTRPNLVAMLTGRPLESNEQLIRPDPNLFLFSKFNKAGYIIGYGEDTYAQTLNLKEHIVHHNVRVPKYDSICLGKMSTPVQTLDYISQFAKAYKKQKFFGFFWFVSATHTHRPDLMADPRLLQDNFINFFNELQTGGVLENTFVFFIGDHGLNYGRVTYHSEHMYYESRLPMFYLWIPHQFRMTYRDKYINLRKNQFRLITHYDTYATLCHILELSNENAEIILPACPNCKSLLQEIYINRNCTDANIEQEWCTCHNVTDARNDVASNQSILTALSNINRGLFIQNIFRRSHHCAPLYIKEILRSHSYTEGNKTYYISTAKLQPGRMVLETIVEKTNRTYQQFKILGIHALSAVVENCAVYPNFPLTFCVCTSKSKIKKRFSKMERRFFLNLNKQNKTTIKKSLLNTTKLNTSTVALNTSQ